MASWEEDRLKGAGRGGGGGGVGLLFKNVVEWLNRYRIFGSQRTKTPR